MIRLTSLKSEPIVISINKIELFLHETLTPQPLTKHLTQFFDSKLKKKKNSYVDFFENNKNN